jgi:hypothetical protein
VAGHEGNGANPYGRGRRLANDMLGVRSAARPCQIAPDVVVEMPASNPSPRPKSGNLGEPRVNAKQQLAIERSYLSPQPRGPFNEGSSHSHLPADAKVRVVTL